MRTLYISVFCLLLSSRMLAQSNTVADATEFAALKSLWESTNGPSWTNKSGWPTADTWPSSATAAEMDNWYGITVTNGDITQVILDNNNLTGILPASLGNLGAATRITLNDNKIAGEIPSGWNSLSRLQDLFLHKNLLTGIIPSEFGSLTNLVNFYVADNQLSGSIPSSFSALTKIKYFDVHNNQLSGTVPSIFTGMTLALGVYLNNNRFTGTLPSMRGANIDVSNNLLTGVFPSVSGTITTITANNNGFTSILASICSSTSLMKLDFGNNNLKSLPSELASNTNKINIQLLVKNNRLDFSNLELYATGFKSTSVLLPQKYINDENTQTLIVGDTLNLIARPLGSGTSVVWEKQSPNGTWTQVASTRAFFKNSAVQSDEGVYRWKSSSNVSAFSGITIQSENILVKTAQRFAIDNWGFQYKYDKRKRMTHKKVPGADWVFMVYDDRDRLVMTQDGEQRKNNRWMITKYDALNRPVLSALYTHSVYKSQAGMDSLISTTAFAESFDGSGDFGYTNTIFPTANLDVLTITYYDNYGFLKGDSYFKYKNNRLTGQEANAFGLVRGQVTGVWTKVLGKDRQWIRTVNYYDDNYHVIQTLSDNHKRGLDVITNVYDFVGKVIDSKTEVIDHHLAWGTKHSSSWILEDRVISKAGSTTYPYAFSTQVIAASDSGWVEFTCSDASITSNRTFGFSTNTSAGQVAYGLIQSTVANSTNTIQPTEGGTLKSTAIPVVAGDIIRIKRKGSTVYYYRNGTQLSYTSSATTSALYAHLIVNQVNAELFNPRISTDGSVKSVARHFNYDHAGRLLETWHSIDNAPMMLLSKQEYNELGQLIDKKLHSVDNLKFRQSIDYRYNIRGWLTSMNGSELGSNNKNADAATERKDLFGMDLLYNNATVSGVGNSPLYNGNISAMMWSSNLGLGSKNRQAYKFSYDPMNRLNAAEQKMIYNNAWTASSASHESEVTYDLNGNIKTLKRTDEMGATMDQLAYDYGTDNVRSNRLQKVSDTGSQKGFVDGAGVDLDYGYDNNGNMVSDANKGITSISYNHLNLPEKITKSDNQYLVYTYDATGRKLAQDVYSSAGLLKKRSDYRGEWFYENDTLRFVNHEEGRAVTEGTWNQAPQLLSDTTMSSTTGYTAADGTNVTLSAVTQSSKTYLKVASNQSTSTPGFLSPFVNIVPGRKYTLRIKGYTTGSAPVVPYVLGNGYESGTVWFTTDPKLPQGSSNEGWIEITFSVATTMNRIRVGMLWKSGVTIGAEFYINTMELYEYNGVHGNAVFAQTGYTYQYHLKDHLGNVRMTFTTKDEVDSARTTLEKDNNDDGPYSFLRYDLAKRVKSSLFDHTKDNNVVDTIGYAVRLNGSANEKIGLAKSLSVMPGDTIRAEVYAKYVDPNSSNWINELPVIMGYFIPPTSVPAGAVIDGAGYSYSGNTSLGITPIGHGSDTDTGIPKAYLNYIFINRNFDLSSVRPLYTRISGGAENGSNVPHARLALEDVITEAGYVYVYLSNDGEGVKEVYFDDFKVEHIKSPVISSQSYYPFGLSFDFYNRENSLANQYKFNGKEEQDELDLGLYDYKRRFYSASLGRFISVDPIADKFPWWTPYQFTGNMPTKFVDLDGMEPASYDFRNGKVYPASDHFRYTPPAGTVPQESYPKGGAGVLNVVGTLSDMLEGPTDPRNTGSPDNAVGNLNKASKIVGPVADIADVAWDASTTDFSDTKQTGDFVENTVKTVVATGFGPAAPAAVMIMSDTQKPSGTTNPLNLQKAYSTTFRQQNSMINARIKLLKDSYTGNNQSGQNGSSTSTTSTSGATGSGSVSGSAGTSSSSSNSSNQTTSCPNGKCPQ